jgi:15-cis-phytoene synthase
MSVELARGMLARGSKSFALAARVLPTSCRDDVAVLYAYCRRADDWIDDAPAIEQPARLDQLAAELCSIYANEPQSDPVLAEFQRVVERYAIPEAYPRALLDGFRSDVGAVRIGTLAELLLYAHRVAGVVGLMSCCVFGVREQRALEHANDLGIAMQLTNVCRDVAEDWRRDRVYLPAELLGSAAGAPLDRAGQTQVQDALRCLLELAERHYASGDLGLRALPLRVAIAVRAARLVYAAIGGRLAAQGYDVNAGRAVVPTWRKLVLVARAVVSELAHRAAAPRRRRLAAEEVPHGP